MDFTGLERLLVVVPLSPILLQRGNALLLAAWMKHRPRQRLTGRVDAIQLAGERHYLRMKPKPLHRLDAGAACAPFLDLRVVRHEVRAILPAVKLAALLNYLREVINAGARLRLAIENEDLRPNDLEPPN